MKLKRSLLLVAIAGTAFVSALATHRALAKEAQEAPVQGTVPVQKRTLESALVNLAAISLPDAVARATASHPGKPLKAELENEDGFLIWSVEMVDASGTTTEVTVDAGNGAVLKTEVDRADDDDDDDDGEDRD